MSDQLLLEDVRKLLPELESFLRDVLAKENLSHAAVKKKNDLLEKLDILRLPVITGSQGLSNHSDSSLSLSGSKQQLRAGRPPRNDDFIAHQRAISRQTEDTASASRSAPVQNGNATMSGVYDDVDVPIDSAPAAPAAPARRPAMEPPFRVQDDENMYEEPSVGPPGGAAALKPKHTGPLSTRPPPPPCPSSDESGTSYESYDEAYENADHISIINTDDVQLPRVKSKKKKKRASAGDVTYNSLRGTTILLEGEVYILEKSAFSTTWVRRVAVLTETSLYCFKDRESKVLITLQLKGWDVVFLEKERGRPYVVRVSHVGCDTFHFSWDTPGQWNMWRERLYNVSSQVDPSTLPSPSGQGEIDYENSGPLVKTDLMPSVSSIGSEGAYTENSSGPTSPIFQAKRLVTANDKNKDKKKKKTIPNILKGTFGKKKGGKVSQQLEIGNYSEMPSKADHTGGSEVSGLIFVRSALLQHNPTDWIQKHCAIRVTGDFDCHCEEDSVDTEFSVKLNECSLESPKDMARELSFRVTRNGAEVFMCEFKDVMEHGCWLQALLKHTQSPPTSADGSVPVGRGRALQVGQTSTTSADTDEEYAVMEAGESPVDHPPDLLRLFAGRKPAFPSVETLPRAADRPPACPDTDSMETASSRDSANSLRSGPEKMEEQTAKVADVNSNVIVCSSDTVETETSPGPTIEGDRDVLDSTKNPVLAKLRSEREESRKSPDIVQTHTGSGASSSSHGLGKSVSTAQMSPMLGSRSKPGEFTINAPSSGVFKKTQSAPRLHDTSPAHSYTGPSFNLSPVSDTAPSVTAPSSVGSASPQAELPGMASVAKNRALFERKEDSARASPGPASRGRQGTPASTGAKWTKPVPIVNSVLGEPKEPKAPAASVVSSTRPPSGAAPNKWSTTLARSTPSNTNSSATAGAIGALSSASPASGSPSGTASGSMLGVFSVNVKKPPSGAPSRDRSPALARLSSESDSSVSTGGGGSAIGLSGRGSPAGSSTSSTSDKTGTLRADGKGSLASGESRPWRATATEGQPRDVSADTEEDQLIKKKLDKLREDLASIRRQRSRIRAERLETSVAAVKERLDTEYKQLEVRYKETNQMIEMLDAKAHEITAERCRPEES